MTRRLTTALLAIATLPPLAGAQGLAYTPQSARYVVTSRIHTVQEVMGQKQEVDASYEQRLSLQATARSHGQLDVSLSLDTLAITQSMGMSPDVSKMIGTKFAGVIGTNGRIVSGSVTVPTGGDTLAPQANGLRTFLPILLEGAKVGGTWNDTVRADVVQPNGSKLKQLIVFTYTFAGDTAVNGTRALKVRYEANTALNGTGNMQGSDYSIEGKSKGVGIALLSSSGQYLGREGSEESNLTVTVEAQGLVIPITQTSAVRIALLK
ncbi:MAG: hypothetical protein HYX65_02475 [Gemmatimonadetes bacterium]|nr:hypothetical protein [Gemmatimonadota bacterium]